MSVFAAPVLTGAMGALAAGRTRQRNISGLLFHSIDSHHYTMSSLPLRQFHAILRTLHEAGWCGITLEACAHTQPTDKRYVALTFDDGCISVMKNALPALEEFGFKATVFPVAGYLGKRSSWDVLPPIDHLTATDLRSISDRGCEIGSHTMTHADLTFLDDAQLRTELRDSKHLLEDIVSRPVSALSFPFGSWNNRAWDAAREIGYSRATIYRNHRAHTSVLLPVSGVYRFDTPDLVLSRLNARGVASVSRCLSACMSHFARGAPLWKFRREYSVARV